MISSLQPPTLNKKALKLEQRLLVQFLDFLISLMRLKVRAIVAISSRLTDARSSLIRRIKHSTTYYNREQALLRSDGWF